MAKPLAGYVLELTTMRIQKYAKSCCDETTWTNILMTPHTYWKPQVVTVQLGVWITAHKEAGLLLLVLCVTFKLVYDINI